MVNSRSFSAQGPNRPHLVQPGSGGVSGEVADLRSDIEQGFQAMEKEVAGPGQAQANIRLNTQPTAADTVTIGADVYEFVAALGDETGSNIGVLRGVDAAAALANIISAINGDGVAGAVSSANGTENVVASIYNTDYLHIEWAASPGGAALPGPKPDVALSDALTAAVAWDHTNLGKTGGDSSLRVAQHVIDVDATNLAADFDVVVPGVPVAAEVSLVTDASDVPDGTGKADSILLTLVQARNAVTVDLDGGATDPVATDKVYLKVTYLAA